MQQAEPLPNILVVSDDRHLLRVAAEWNAQSMARVVVCATAAEAEVILHDIRFIGTRLDAVLVDYKLSDKAGCRFTAEQRDNFPEAAFAMISDFNSTALSMWARAFQVLLLAKPVLVEDLQRVLLPAPGIGALGIKLDLQLEQPVRSRRARVANQPA